MRKVQSIHLQQRTRHACRKDDDDQGSWKGQQQMSCGLELGGQLRLRFKKGCMRLLRSFKHSIEVKNLKKNLQVECGQQQQQAANASEQQWQQQCAGVGG